jgi:hypothetical protein
MDAREFELTLRRLCEQRPFRPFFVELTNGELVEVWRPEAIRPHANNAGIQIGDRWYSYDRKDVVRIQEMPRREVRVMTRDE